ncbi:Putative pre-mRNA-splicing factor ATP-dependent RNA helicase DHX32 [Larimichthys crocea]|uniref:Uncharacterized protein n=1 Tax=Larimichthys crocea TaxID=215358 RepID=A0ACD3RTZ3_LARCR|nr:Putative pre-mRNA-splicing factor ATP-dependent RNA helicase DHX32 [Larimichthys crocea]
MTAKLLSHYGHIPLISLEPSSPARVVHSNSGNKDYFYSALRLVLEIHRTKEDGDVVVFFASAQDNQLPAENSPQIMESNITPTVLFLKRMEIAGLGQCDFIDRPDPEGLMQALEELDYLAALDDDGNLSEIGIIMSEIPLDPQMAKALLASCEFDCVCEMLTIAAMLTAPSCFLEPPAGITHEAVQCHRKFQHPEGDHFTLINIYNGFKRSQREQYFSAEKWCQDYFLDYSALKTAEAIRSELNDTLNRIELPISEPSFGTKTNTHNIKRALLAGFFMQIARDVDGAGNYFILTHKHVANVHPLSGYWGSVAQSWGCQSGSFSMTTPCQRTTALEQSLKFPLKSPLYFFYNLPPSESKDILQDMLDPDGKREDEKQKAATIGNDADSGCAVVQQTQDRCVIQ